MALKKIAGKPDRQVALLRGINVGKAKRVAMADLRALLADLGFGDVRTLLNSGNIVYTANGVPTKEAGRKIEKGLVSKLGVASRVTVLTAAQLMEAVDENPLTELATDPTRLFIAFLADPSDRSRLEPLLEEDWGSERLAIGSRVAYLWCPDGLLKSRLPEAVGKLLGDAVTTRNWSTVKKLHALVTA